MRRRVVGLIFSIVAPAAQANLVVNGGNEDALVGGNIPGWTEVVGSAWTQRRLNPLPYEGSNYFYAGAVANATLRQTVDVSSFAARIDGAGQAFQFTARVRSFEQSPVDSSRIVVTYLAANSAVLATFDTEEIRDTSAWQLVTDTRLAPASTRSIRIDLIATRYVGSNNDGYFDAVTLTPVPEPASYLLMALGLGAIIAGRRIVKRP